MEHPLVTSLVRILTKAAVAFLMLFAVSMPAMAELQLGGGATAYVTTNMGSPDAGPIGTVQQPDDDDDDERSSGSDVCHVGHCAHNLSMPAALPLASTTTVARTTYLAAPEPRLAVQSVQGLKRPPRV